MNASLSIRVAMAASLAFALQACISLAPDPEEPAIVSALPEGFDFQTNSADYQPQDWWTGFEDPVLDGLVAKALEKNLDIAQSVARLEQVRAQARIARASLLPSLEGSATANESSTPLVGTAFGDLAGGAPISRIQNEVFAPSVTARYELDLFARNRNDAGAAQRDAAATAFDLQTVRLTTAAEVISTYFEIVNARRQIDLSTQIAGVLDERAARTQTEFERGLAESFELYQIRQQLRATQASVPQLESSLANAENRMAVLVAEFPGAIDATLDRPLTPRLVFEPVPAGLPADLLSSRPDIAAAWIRLEAARLRIGARRAERFPQLNLSASFGGQGDTIASGFNLADNWTRSLAASIVAPIFNAGRISANIKAARGVYDQRAAAYAQTVLQAMQETATAFTEYEKQRKRYLLVTAQAEEANRSLDLQTRRFASGIGSYLSYLDALTAAYQVRAELSSAAQSTALARLSVHRALAGDWAPEREPQKPEMRPIMKASE